MACEPESLPVPAEPSLAERLRSWAQNEEMVDQYYTAHGRDCNEAADLLTSEQRLEGQTIQQWAERAKISEKNLAELQDSLSPPTPITEKLGAALLAALDPDDD